MGTVTRFCIRILLHMVVLHASNCKQSATSATCNLAHAVLTHISASQVSVPKLSTHKTRPDSNATVRHTAACPDLHHYITLLPVPAAPPAWNELCTEVEKQRTAAALATWLYPNACKLPDIQGSAAAGCQLGRNTSGYVLQQPLLSAYLASLFLSVVIGRSANAKQLGAPAPNISRFDLFHGHLFVADNHGASTAPQQQGLANASTPPAQQHIAAGQKGSSRPQTVSQQPHVGILFHAAEYPVYDPETFPVFLGHCQHNSTSPYHARSMDLRNMLWYQDKLAVLDVGTHSPLHALLHEGTEPLRTVYEDDFGQPIADLLLLCEPQKHRRRKLVTVQRLEQERLHRLMRQQQTLKACSSDALGVFISF